MRVAAAQAASVWLDPSATASKAVGLLERAARDGVELVVFPETFMSGYPFWVMLGGGGRFGDPDHARTYGAYLEAAVELEGPELRVVAQAARDLGVFVFLGVAERGTGSGRGTVYCTLVAIDPERGIVGAHRKLNPTHSERVVWGRGDGNGLRTHRVGALRVGGLNCWENWMPLARHALYADGEEVHVAARPGSAAQTGDIARFIALEGRVFVVLASGLISAGTVPAEFPFYPLIREKPEGFYNGGSCIVSPDGSWVVEPRVGEEELLVADLDPARIAAARHSLDPAGHYARTDVFAVTVDRRRQQAAGTRSELVACCLESGSTSMRARIVRGVGGVERKALKWKISQPLSVRTERVPGGRALRPMNGIWVTGAERSPASSWSGSSRARTDTGSMSAVGPGRSRAKSSL